MGHTTVGVMRHRAAEVLRRDILSGDRLDDLRPGDEHVGARGHEHEIRERRGVHRPAGAGPHDRRDLRDDPRCEGIAIEDLSVPAESVHPLLDPRAAGIVYADHGRPGFHGEVHHFADLAGVHLSQGAAHDREVLGKEEYPSALHGTVSGNDTFPRRIDLVHAEVGAAMAGKHVELHETSGVE